MILFDLPKDISKTILHDWLNGLKDLSHLDIAFCSSSLRSDFIAFMHEMSLCIDQFDVMQKARRKSAEAWRGQGRGLDMAHHANFIAWLSARHVRATSLIVQTSSLQDIACLEGLCLPFVRELTFCNDLAEGEVDRELLVRLLARFPSLTSVDLGRAWYDITDKEASALILARPKLRQLHLNDCWGLSERCVGNLALVFRNSLEELHSNETSVSDLCLQAIGTLCGKLHSIDLRGERVSTTGLLRFCKSSPSLRFLSLHDFTPDQTISGDEVVVGILSALPSLDVLLLPACNKTTCKVLDFVRSNRPQLQILSTADLQLSLHEESGCAFEWYSALPEKDVLEAMEAFSSGVGLTMLSVQRASILSAKSWQVIADRHGHTLRHLQIECHRGLGDAVMIYLLKRCNQLLSLSLSRCYALTDSFLREMTNNCSSLQEISFSQGCQLSDGAMAALVSRSPRLHTLKLVQCIRVGNATLTAALILCPQLTRLAAINTALSEEVLVKLLVTRNKPRLREVRLDISSCCRALLLLEQMGEGEGEGRSVLQWRDRLKVDLPFDCESECLELL